MRDITDIVLHHSASPIQALTWNDIRRIHVEERKWKDIGYHAGIVHDGAAWSVALGRAPEIVGAHAEGHNAHSLGICFEGNYELDYLPREAFLLGAVAVLDWMRAFGVPWQRVVPHRALKATACPGKNFPYYEFVGYLRDRVGG